MFTVLAAANGAAAGGDVPAAGGGMTMTIVMIGAMVAFFYFFMIRPENKKKKKLNEMRESMTVGDTITTIGGIVGKVVSIDKTKETVTFETGEDRVRVQVAKWAISTVGKGTEEPA